MLSIQHKIRAFQIYMPDTPLEGITVWFSSQWSPCSLTIEYGTIKRTFFLSCLTKMRSALAVIQVGGTFRQRRSWVSAALSVIKRLLTTRFSSPIKNS
jgi:hypothetical protein